ncbi:MAG: hypothetical protein BGO51_01535 [Rhodospirillales bacterium 69-11]|jgi:hypothetical protein|nr:hypothetical protein [Rhodospirillales bacterium]MBN8925567.1 hypothetical protein [Rhodospirillales bacterium]OJW25679.1 MAG: hypothetical protein BGO51_01535 [Rhodospirillales bacterium 69-11]
MRKTMMLAGLLLTLGTGAAFAGDGNVYVPQLDNVVVDQSSPTVRVPVQQVPAHNRSVFAASNRPTTSVYGLFSHPGYPQGGDN